ncbi:spore coat protein CotJB [Desulfotomaculum defluvii]
MDANAIPQHQHQLLMQIMQLEFAAVELNLFLDTHPDCQEALTQFNQIHQQLMQCKHAYEQVYGPLINYGFSANVGNSWRWVETPWPWEIKY